MLRKFSILAFALIISFSFSKPASAQEDEAARVALAEKLIAETVSSNFVDQMIGSTWPLMESQIKSKNPDVDEGVLTELRTLLAKQQKELVANLIVDLPKAYAGYFTLEELEKVYEFQTSDVGKKVISVQPKLMAEFMPRVMQSIQSQMPQMMEAFKNSVREKGLEL